MTLPIGSLVFAVQEGGSLYPLVLLKGGAVVKSTEPLDGKWEKVSDGILRRKIA